MFVFLPDWESFSSVASIGSLAFIPGLHPSLVLYLKYKVSYWGKVRQIAMMPPLWHLFTGFTFALWFGVFVSWICFPLPIDSLCSSSSLKSFRPPGLGGQFRLCFSLTNLLPCIQQIQKKIQTTCILTNKNNSPTLTHMFRSCIQKPVNTVTPRPHHTLQSSLPHSLKHCFPTWTVCFNSFGTTLGTIFHVLWISCYSFRAKLLWDIFRLWDSQFSEHCIIGLFSWKWHIMLYSSVLNEKYIERRMEPCT